MNVVVVSMYGAMFVRMSDVHVSVYCLIFEKISVKKLQNKIFAAIYCKIFDASRILTKVKQSFFTEL